MKRFFTPEEDELIRQYAAGQISVRKLERQLKAHRDTIEDRACDLGLSITASVPAAQQRYIQDTGENPHSVGEDGLLKGDLQASIMATG